MLNYTQIDDGNGYGVTLSNGGTNVAVVAPKALIDNPEVGGPVHSTLAGLNDAAADLVSNAPDLSDEGLLKRGRHMVDTKLSGRLGLAVESYHSADRQWQREMDRWHTPRFPEGTTDALKAELRSHLATLPLNQKIEAAKADPLMAAAMIEAGPARSNIPQDVFDRMRRDMAIGQLADELMRQHPTDFATAPSAADPIGGSPDPDAARKVAAEKFERMEAERETLDSVSGLLSNVVAAVAMLTGETPQDAYLRLTK